MCTCAIKALALVYLESPAKAGDILLLGSKNMLKKVTLHYENGLLTMHHHMSAYFGAEDPVERQGWTNSKPSSVPAFDNASRAETVLGLNYIKYK